MDKIDAAITRLDSARGVALMTKTNRQKFFEEQNNKLINEMLSKLPDNVQMNDAIVKTFERLSPLTVEKFQTVSVAYGLSAPMFRFDKTAFRSEKDNWGNFFVG